MKKIINVDFRMNDQKRAERKQKMQNKLKNTFEWIRNNRDVIILITPAVIACIGGATKISSKILLNHRVNKEIDFKRRHIYDHSIGRYIELKRPLSSKQALTIEQRRAKGEKLHVILDSMGLMKG